MEPPSQAELVCLYLDAVEGATVGAGAGDGESPARAATDTPPRTVRGIATALALEREGSGPRIGLLSTLSELAEEGLVARDEVRPDGGSERSVYHLTEAGNERAAALRERFRDETVAVADGSTEAVPVADLEGYFDEYPLVQALARLDDEGTIRLEADVGSEFVDREAELERLASLLETVPQQGSRTVLVSGPAGVGKTTLVEQWLPAAREAGFRVASGRCRRDGDRPYGPLLSAFSDLEAPDDLVDPLETAAYEVDDAEAYDAQRTALFNEVADALRAQAADTPLVLFLDDLQWAGRGTRQLFAHLTRTVTDWLHPVAFVATYRSEAAAGDRAFDAVVSDVADGDRTSTLAVGPLPESDSNGLVAWLANRPDLPDELLSALRERTGGNPLLLRATVKQLLDDGALDPEDPTAVATDPASLPVPEDAHAAVESRLPALSERTREVLAATAVAGGAVAPPLVAAVLDEPEAVVNDHYDVLVTGHFLERTPDGVAFVGGLVRDAVVESLGDERRRQLHTAVASAIESVDAVETRPARVAHHNEQAGDLEAALAAYRRAGDEAREVYAHEDAIETYERALAVARELDDGETVVALRETLGETTATMGRYEAAREQFAAARERTESVATRQRLYARAGRSYDDQGDFEAAIETATAGLALTGDDAVAPLRDDDGDRETPPVDDHTERPEVADLLSVMASALRQTGDHDAAETAAEHARSVARAADAPQAEARALRRLGSVAQASGAYEAAADHLAASLEIARELDDRPEIAGALKNLGIVAIRRGDLDSAAEYFEESLAINRETGDRWGESAGLHNLGFVAESRGDLAAAAEHYEESLAIDRELGDRAGESHCLQSLGRVARNLGDVEAAASRYEESLSIARSVGERRVEATSLYNLGEVALDRGEPDVAEGRFEESLAINRETDDRQGESASLHNLGLVAEHRGELAVAAERYDAALAIQRDIGYRQGEAASLESLGGVARRRGQLDEAVDYFEQALAIQRDIDDRRGESTTLRELGTVALRRGDLEGATERYEAALSIQRDIEYAGGQVETLRDLATVARRRGELDAATKYVDETLSLARDVGDATNEGATLVVRGEVERERGDLDAAASSVEEGLELVRAADDRAYEGKGLLALGRVGQKRGDLDDAADRYRAALGVARDSGHRLQQLAALEALAELHEASGEAETAREHCEAALALVEEHDADGLRQRAGRFRELFAALDD
jgi:tetratricopeptide (TPR) repeat protein